MITWASLAIAALSVSGIACCGIGAISIFAGSMSDDPRAGDQAARGGCTMGAVGLILIALAAVVRLA